MWESNNMVHSLVRDRWVVLLLLGGLTLLLVLVVQGYGVGVPAYPATEPRPTSGPAQLAVDQYASLFAASAVPRFPRASNDGHLFLTRYFEPQPKPQPKPATSRKVTLVYLGFFTTPAAGPRAFLRVDKSDLVGSLGTAVIDDYAIAAIEPTSLVLTNGNAQTNRLDFKVPVSMDVPIR